MHTINILDNWAIIPHKNFVLIGLLGSQSLPQLSLLIPGAGITHFCHSCSHLEQIKNRVCFPGPVSLWSMFSKHSFLHLPPSPIGLLPPHLVQISAKVRTNNLPEVMFGTIMSLCLLLFPSFSNSMPSVLLKKKTFRKLISFYPTLK